MSLSKKYADWMVPNLSPTSMVDFLRHNSILTARKRRLLIAALCDFLYTSHWDFCTPTFPNYTSQFRDQSLTEITFAKLCADGKTKRGDREKMLAEHRGDGNITVNCLFGDLWNQESVVIELLTNRHHVPPYCIAYIIRDLFNPLHPRLDQMLCCCGSELDGSHEHNTCGPPIEELDACLTSTVVNLANGIYADERYCDLPILADALEESGCTDAHLLSHLRETEFDLTCFACAGAGGIETDTGGSEPWGSPINDWQPCPFCGGNGIFKQVPHKHFLGCWALDSVLGRR